MIKLTQILKEALLLEKIVKLPQQELDKAKELYDYIDENLKSLLDSLAKTLGDTLIVKYFIPSSLS